MRAILAFILMFGAFYLTWLTAMYFKTHYNFVNPFTFKWPFKKKQQ